MSLELVPLFGKLFGLVDQAVEDKDKRNELRLAALEVQTAFNTALVTTSTVPWADALVKVLYALVALAAPIGTAAMTAFGLWCTYKQIPMDGFTAATTVGAFPAWRTARHFEKKAGVAVPAAEPRQRRATPFP